ncbi:hypothetical protein E4S40_00970 [Algoriphagus kandeliae]|uniref:Peptide O-xylosyltransferase n=1 Tax=Algoriphagus kandeliae TaxID=2562278 RepID=A0A4Y9QY36_9BACT|nr:beta-1,6-N-acetylglucosaminyltransferase [Algoriphagus kandeliae]TFV97259.1 hypothetical protein E4S40_00970 [Algoriphagus kandeliae]
MYNKPYAILIISHKSKNQLERIISFFENSLFEVYIHLDKTADFKLSDIKGEFRPLINQLPCSWGEYNVTLATFSLLEKAFNDGKKYFFLISGEDFPIKSKEYLHEFVKENILNDFFNVIPLSEALNDSRLINFKNRFRFVHIPKRSPSNFLEKIKFSFFYRFKKLQIKYDFLKFSIPRNIYVGVNWFNLSRDTVEKLLIGFKGNFLLRQRLKICLSSEEILPHTLFWIIHNPQTWINDSLRFAKWKERKANPEYLDKSDVDDLLKSPALFARKFNDISVIDYLEGKLLRIN